MLQRKCHTGTGSMMSLIPFCFSFPFLLAPLSLPILGTLFLAAHQLLVDAHHCHVLLSSSQQPLMPAATTDSSPLLAFLQACLSQLCSLLASYPTVFSSEIFLLLIPPMAFSVTFPPLVPLPLPRLAAWTRTVRIRLSLTLPSLRRLVSFTSPVVLGLLPFIWYPSPLVPGGLAVTNTALTSR